MFLLDVTSITYLKLYKYAKYFVKNVIFKVIFMKFQRSKLIKLNKYKK